MTTFQPKDPGHLSGPHEESHEEVATSPGRRAFLGGLAGLLAASALPAPAVAQALRGIQSFGPSSQPGQGFLPTLQGQDAANQAFWAQPRVLRLRRAQNGETFEAAYWRDGQLDLDAYRRLCWLLRDIHVDVVRAIDPTVLDLVCAMQAWVSYYGYRKPFIVNSGYRTRGTNEKLEGAARNSMHLYGRAIDLVMPDLPVSYMGKLAQHYLAGGVGFYPSSGFVHVDTGRIRTWSRR